MIGKGSRTLARTKGADPVRKGQDEGGATSRTHQKQMVGAEGTTPKRAAVSFDTKKGKGKSAGGAPVTAWATQPIDSPTFPGGVDLSSPPADLFELTGHHRRFEAGVREQSLYFSENDKRALKAPLRA